MGTDPLPQPYGVSPHLTAPADDTTGPAELRSMHEDAWLRRYGTYRGITIDIVIALVLQVALAIQYNQLIAPMAHAPVWVGLTTAFLGTFVAPPIEELFFRGYVYRALAGRKSLLWAMLISSAVFAAFHFLPTLFPELFLAGLLFS